MQIVSTSELCEYCPEPHQYKVKDDRLPYKWINVCRKCKTKIRTRVFKVKMLKYKGGKCQVCGYSKCIAALHFHHLVPEEKSFALSSALSKSWILVLKELDKCVVLCANCHAEEHNAPVAPGKSMRMFRYLGDTSPKRSEDSTSRS